MRSIVWLVRWRKIFVRSKPVMLVRMSWTSLRMKTVLGSASKPTKVFEEKKFCSTFVTRRLESTEKTTRTAARPNQWTKHSINDERKTSSTKGRTGDEKEEIRRQNNENSYFFIRVFLFPRRHRPSFRIHSFVCDRRDKCTVDTNRWRKSDLQPRGTCAFAQLQKKKFVLPSRKHPMRYIVGMRMTKANKSSMNVFNALYVIIRQGKCETDLNL